MWISVFIPSIGTFLQPHSAEPTGHRTCFHWLYTQSADKKVCRLWWVQGQLESALQLHTWRTHVLHVYKDFPAGKRFPRPLKKKGSADCCADEVTDWMETPAFKERGEERLWIPFAAWFWSGFGAAWNSDYAKITFKTIDFVEKRKMKKLYHFISNPIMGLCMLPLAGTAGCNMAA